ncbi:uncharacterized protein LOC110247594 [Exaiptasia diaphana]|uniref:Uncharacterized protein n=1 Tax=Exaiptasia diaphana TaxID=2652724 RepID=A0A913XVA7_EXADI|nr:uncharacterized protein LOC110247594 [Exaiptasia diaphana]
MAPSQTFLRIPLILLLIFPVVSDATNSTSSKNTTKSASESQTNDAAKCLKSLNDVKRELTSTVPPLHGWTTDNYNNISRALFPGVKLPSLYIKVTLQFIVNDTGPGTGKLSDEVLKFTWSQSCIFVSNVCLNAKTVFSLGTVYPQRRETELVLSSHKLCEDNSETYWIYALLGLQDIAIIPNVSDPRVNTAQCVVPGHEGDKEQPLNVTNCNPDEWYNYRLYWILSASVFLAISICWYTFNWIRRKPKKDGKSEAQIKNEEKRKGVLTKTFFLSVGWIFILSVILIVFEIINFVNCYQLKSSTCIIILHFVFIILFWVGNIIIIIFYCCKCCKCCKCRCKCSNKDCLLCKSARGILFVGKWFMFPCIYQIVYHLLWVLCAGIPADPSWAIPLFLCECLVIFSLVCATYFFLEADGNDTCMVILQLFVSFIAICLAVFTVLISFFGRNVADIPTNNIFEIIMAAVLLWAIKNSGLAPDNNDNGQGRRQGNGQGTEIEMQTEQDRQQEPLVTIG